MLYVLHYLKLFHNYFILKIHFNASTLMSLSPIILIPVSHFMYKEKITWRAVVGTLVAIGGAAWLFFL